MDPRISGRKVAAGITTAVTVGSFSIAGISVVAMNTATHSATTSSAVSTATATPTDTGQSSSTDSGQSSGLSGSSDSSLVQPGNGGNISGRSSGS